MSIELVCLIAALLPVLLVPSLMPLTVLLARRKRLTDAPNARKLQSEPVAVLGGMVIITSISLSLTVTNVFYDINSLFPSLCIMIVMFVFGMFDDLVGLSWTFKFGLQMIMVMLLFFCGSFGFYSFYGLFGLYDTPYWLSFLLSAFFGLLLINAVNFIDGIDGLASSMGVLIAGVMAYWNYYHSFMVSSLLSMIVGSTLLMFFFYNVFSSKYKIYMGDSGSLLLGLFVYISANPAPYNTLNDEFLVDRYFISFLLALTSGMTLDLVRVVLTRLLRGQSPFHPDRNHLHHVFVDLGISHLMATLHLLFRSVVMLVVWYVSAIFEMQVTMQFFVVLICSAVLFWLPFIRITFLKEHYPLRYVRLSHRWQRCSKWLDPFANLMSRILDGRRKVKTIGGGQ